ncbi:MAG: magnesium protoporphyrin IX methyltransferase [Rhizomicrobium sp.]
MSMTTYFERRRFLEDYFDRTAFDAWKQLTSDAPVSKIRRTVRAGRDRMRAQLLDWLPADLTGTRLLDAGCGTGALSFEAARRGGEIIAVDVSAGLIEIASERLPPEVPDGMIDFRVGDMLDPDFGHIDHVVAMDSLIHYETPDIVAALAGLAPRTSTSIVFTVAPRTPMLTAMRIAGRAFPRGDRAPAIVPVGEGELRRRIAAEVRLTGWRLERTARVMTGFYKSQAFELVRA